MKTLALAAAFAAIIFSSAVYCTTVSAMPSAGDHIAGLGDLPGTNAIIRKTGLSAEQVKDIHRWMDAPSKTYGPHHGSYRHSVQEVTEHFAKQGIKARSVRTIARMHKIQDVAYNALPVDGWVITNQRRGEAVKLLEYAETNGKLPRSLPAWVDETAVAAGGAVTAASAAEEETATVADDIARSGDDAVEGAADSASSAGKGKAGTVADDLAKSADDVAEEAAHSASTAARGKAGTIVDDLAGSTDEAIEGAAKSAGKAGKVLKFAGKAAGPVAFVAEASIRGYDSYETEQAYKRGEITNEERLRKHGKSGGQLVGGTVGGWGGFEAGALVGGGIGAFFGGVGAPVGAAIGGVVGAIGGAIGGDYVGGKAGEAVGGELAM